MTTSTETQTVHHPDPAMIRRQIAKRSFAMLSTVSPAGVPHAAGVLYELVDDALYVNTLRTSRKARNVAGSQRVAVAIPVRRMPVGAPPSAIHFQSRASLVAVDDPTIVDLVARGRLRSITGHGELDHPDGCFVRIELPRRLHTYGLGMSLTTLARNPLAAAGVVELVSPSDAGRADRC